MDLGEKDRKLSEIELKLQAIWCDVLEKGSVPVDVSFFDAGGNSILLLKLVMKIINEMDSKITVPDVFSILPLKLCQSTLKLYKRSEKNWRTI